VTLPFGDGAAMTRIIFEFIGGFDDGKSVHSNQR
jgi:hypothetical protein